MADNRIQVQMPDGAIIDAPAGTSKEAIQARWELSHLQNQRAAEFDAATKARDAARPGQRWLADATSPKLEQLDEEIGKRKDVIAKSTAEQGGLLDKAAYYAKQGGSAVLRGLLQLPAMAASAGMSTDPQRYSNIPASAPLTSAAKVGMQPQGTGEQYTSRAIEGATAALASPGGFVKPVQSAVSGVTSALGSEGAAKLLGDNPVSRLLGGLLGGGLGAAATSRAGQVRPNTAALASEATEGITPEMLTKAQDFMKQASAKGVTVDLAQALEATGAPASNITTIRNVLANSQHGNEVQQTLRDQPSHLQVAATSQVGGMPGTVYSEGQAANNLQDTATKAIQAVKDERTKLWSDTLTKTSEASKTSAADALAKAMSSKEAADTTVTGATASMRDKLAGALSGTHEPSDFLEAAVPVAQANAAAREAGAAVTAAKAGVRNAASVPPETVLSASSDLQKLIAASPNTGKAAALARLQKNLFDSKTGAPITDPYKLNEILKSESNKLKSPDLSTTGIDAGTAKWVGLQIDQLRKKFGESFAPVRAANARFSQFTTDTLDPLRQGPVGQLATPKGYKPDVQASLAKMNGLFSAGVDPQARVSPIRTAATELAKVDKTAFADAAKTYYSGKVSEAFDPSLGGAPATNADAAKRLWTSMFSNEKQYQGMKDTVASVAKTYGKSEAEAVKGLESFAQITKALKSRPNTVGGLQRDEVFSISGKNYGADAMRVFGFLPFEHAARAVEGHVMGNVFRDFDKMLTTPEGVDTLIKLSKQPVMSKTAINILATAGGTAAGSGSD